MGETSALSTVILEGLDGVKIVKIEGREDYERERVGHVVARRQRFLIKGSNAKAVAGPVTEALMTVLIAGILAYAGWRALGGAMDAAQFTTFLAALVFAAQALRQLGGMQTTLSEAAAAAGRLFETLDIEPTIKDAPGAGPLKPGAGAIVLEDVVFRYGDAAPALDGVSLRVERGQTVALVGPSGGGKSTILNLIPRFYDVTSGRVLIDGQDVREVTQRSVRERIALVTQEPFLFDDTVRANIAYGRPGAAEADIVAAAKAAAAHDFITSLPQGYDTIVGEAGARISGGQRQRIAIARAFLKDAPILLLDEATSALDTESEAQVQAALERLMSGRATILIAHRLSTVRSADRIYVIEAGRIVQTGTHAQLMKQRGLYARLAAAQNLDLKAEAAR
jgi:subfamily B ATP-binding cassette protein MsbA